MPGPPPKKNARRRNARPDWVSLPAEGYKGRIPAWPLSSFVKGEDGEIGLSAKPKASTAERALWRQLWRTPQAAQWAELGWTRVVARYCRWALAAELPTAQSTILGEVRQLEDKLGLTPMAMKRLQWEIAEAETSAEGEVVNIDSVRARLA